MQVVRPGCIFSRYALTSRPFNVLLNLDQQLSYKINVSLHELAPKQAIPRLQHQPLRSVLAELADLRTF